MNSGLLVITLLALAGGNEPIVLPPISPDPLAPRTVVTPVLHTGDPAPGIPNAIMEWMLAPQIAADGRVLIDGNFRIEGEPFVRAGLWFGHSGELQLIAYAGMQAVDLPDGVILANIGEAHVSETGWIAYTSNLFGPGILFGVNSMALFCGPPGDIHKVLQGGEPAPGLEPGTIIDVSDGFGLTPWLSDNATMLVIAWLFGPNVSAANDEAMWIGPRDNLQLIWRKGMVAPGTNGARFKWADLLTFNDAGEIAFRGALVGGEIVEGVNSVGRWVGGTEGLDLLTWAGSPAPGFPPEITLAGAGGGLTGLNHLGVTCELTLLQGSGIGSQNNLILYAGTADDLLILRREDDLAPEAGPSVVFNSFSSVFINQRGEMLHSAHFRGPGIDESNNGAFYFGLADDMHMILRDGEPAPFFSPELMLSTVGSQGGSALNDSGDVLVWTKVTGPGVNPTNSIVIWFYDKVRHDWFPLLRAGTAIGSHEAIIPDSAALSVMYQYGTGGSDGYPQAINDEGAVAMKVTMADGTHGIYVFRLRWLGDGDGDGDVDIYDFGGMLDCSGAPQASAEPECAIFDYDEDGDVDRTDARTFQVAFTGSQ